MTTHLVNHPGIPEGDDIITDPDETDAVDCVECCVECTYNDVEVLPVTDGVRVWANDDDTGMAIGLNLNRGQVQLLNRRLTAWLKATS